VPGLSAAYLILSSADLVKLMCYWQVKFMLKSCDKSVRVKKVACGI